MNIFKAHKNHVHVPGVVIKYQQRVSGSILDYIDIHIEVSRVDYEKSSDDQVGEISASIRARVQVGLYIQTRRFSKIETLDFVGNGDMHIGEIRKFCKLRDEDQSLRRSAMRQLNVSACAYHLILKLARTIADLAGCEEIQLVHLAEALHYRPQGTYVIICTLLVSIGDV